MKKNQRNNKFNKLTKRPIEFNRSWKRIIRSQNNKRKDKLWKRKRKRVQRSNRSYRMGFFYLFDRIGLNLFIINWIKILSQHINFIKEIFLEKSLSSILISESRFPLFRYLMLDVLPYGGIISPFFAIIWKLTIKLISDQYIILII